MSNTRLFPHMDMLRNLAANEAAKEPKPVKKKPRRGYVVGRGDKYKTLLTDAQVIEARGLHESKAGAHSDWPRNLAPRAPTWRAC